MGAYNFANADIVMMLGGQLLFIYFVAMIFLFNDEPFEEQIRKLMNTATNSSKSNNEATNANAKANAK